MKSRATLTTGTAKEHAEHGEGFSANGESMWTRRAAHPDDVRMKGYERDRKRPKNVHASHVTDVRFNEIEIARMERAVKVEKNPVRLAKLQKNIAIKSAFVERLKCEEEEGIETIFGADEYEKWDRIK